MTATALPASAREGANRSAAKHFAATNAASERFFDAHADAIALACHAMAQRFQQGGRMFVCGDGAQRSDVAHVVVEFLHPVVVGKRALPALALPEMVQGAARRAFGTLAREGDLLLLLTAHGVDEAARELLSDARKAGVLTIVLRGKASETETSIDHVFAVPSRDPCVVQETHEMVYHVLWELVHVFFEHRSVPS